MRSHLWSGDACAPEAPLSARHIVMIMARGYGHLSYSNDAALDTWRYDGSIFSSGVRWIWSRDAERTAANDIINSRSFARAWEMDEK